IFRMNKDGSGFSVIHIFESDGTFPTQRLARDADGFLYGITLSGGISNAGTIYKVHSSGSGFVVLHNFSIGSIDGYFPEGLILGSDGFLYGTTSGGGTNNVGPVFRVNTSGSE